MKFLGSGLFVAAATLLLTALAFAQEDQFMSEAAQDGMAKIQWAYLALQNSQNEQIKLFAQQVLSDYAQSQSDLIFIANQHQVLLPRNLNSQDRDTVEALSQLKGAAFDKAYMKAMLNGRQADLSRFKQKAAEASTAGVMNWANKTLPALQNTLKEAQKIAPVVGVQPAAKNEEQPGRSASDGSSNTASRNPY